LGFDAPDPLSPETLSWNRPFKWRDGRYHGSGPCVSEEQL
jgi:hypothetical protein